MSRTLEALIEKLGNPVNKSGDENVFLCNKCSSRGKTPDTKGHLYVNIQEGMFICHRCGWKGHLSFMLKSMGIVLSQTTAGFSDVAKRLLNNIGKGDTSYDNTMPIEYPCETVHPIMNDRVWAYLTNPKPSGRGLTIQQINFYHIVAGTGVWSDRVFIPTLYNGEVVYWVARSISGRQPKYLNPKNTSKSYYLFGLEQAKTYDCVVITEGVFSAIAAGPNAVAAFGKYVSMEQRKMLMEFKQIVIALDSDAQKEQQELANWFAQRRNNVYIVTLPVGLDPDSDEHFQDRVKNAPLYNYYTLAKTRIET